jgi:hypothetical protein
MQTESLGKVLPRILFPYVQQWAERSGMTLLSRLLVDEQFRELIEKYGDEIVTRMAQAVPAPGNGNGKSNGNGSGNGNGTRLAPRANGGGNDADVSTGDFASLQDRVLAMEAQQEAQQALFEVLRTRIRPLALALGCCPECLVGVEGCPKCWGQSKVAHYKPDYTLLATQVVNPLVARGVPLVLSEMPASRADHHSAKSTATSKRSRPWPKK